MAGFVTCGDLIVNECRHCSSVAPSCRAALNLVGILGSQIPAGRMVRPTRQWIT